MKRLTNEEQFKPVLEVLLYKAKDGVTGDTSYRALTAEIFNKDGHLIRGALKDLAVEDANELRTAFADLGQTESFSGLLPENVLACSSNGLVWWVSATQRPLYLTENLAAETGLNDGELYNFPPMLFVSQKGRVQVFILKKNCRPTEKSAVGMAPFWNVGENGFVCFGSAKRDRTTNVSDQIACIEKAFFQSQFSHYMGTRHRVSDMTCEVAWGVAKYESFPVENVLPASPATLGELVSSLRI